MTREARPRFPRATSSAALHKCLARSACALVLARGKLAPSDSRVVKALMAAHRTLGFAFLDTSRYEISLPSQLAAVGADESYSGARLLVFAPARPPASTGVVDVASVVHGPPVDGLSLSGEALAARAAGGRALDAASARDIFDEGFVDADAFAADPLRLLADPRGRVAIAGRVYPVRVAAAFALAKLVYGTEMSLETLTALTAAADAGARAEAAAANTSVAVAPFRGTFSSRDVTAHIASAARGDAPDTVSLAVRPTVRERRRAPASSRSSSGGAAADDDDAGGSASTARRGKRARSTKRAASSGGGESNDDRAQRDASDGDGDDAKPRRRASKAPKTSGKAPAAGAGKAKAAAKAAPGAAGKKSGASGSGKGGRPAPRGGADGEGDLAAEKERRAQMAREEAAHLAQEAAEGDGEEEGGDGEEEEEESEEEEAELEDVDEVTDL